MATLTQTTKKRKRRTTTRVSKSSKFTMNTAMSSLKDIGTTVLGMLLGGLVSKQLNNILIKPEDNTAGFLGNIKTYLSPTILLVGGIYLGTTMKDKLFKNLALGLAMTGGLKIAQNISNNFLSTDITNGLGNTNTYALPEYTPGNVLPFNGTLISDGVYNENVY